MLLDAKVNKAWVGISKQERINGERQRAQVIKKKKNREALGDNIERKKELKSYGKRRKKEKEEN